MTSFSSEQEELESRAQSIIDNEPYVKAKKIIDALNEKWDHTDGPRAIVKTYRDLYYYPKEIGCPHCNSNCLDQIKIPTPLEDKDPNDKPNHVCEGWWVDWVETRKKWYNRFD